MLSKLRLIFVKYWWTPIVAVIFFTSIIVFISTSIQLFFFPGNTFAKNAENFFRFFFISSGDASIGYTLYCAIVSILFFVLSNILKFNNSLRENIGGISLIFALIGILNLMLYGLLNPTPIYFINDNSQVLKSAFFRTLEYSFFSSLYLFSIVGVYRVFFINENTE
jgi:hypothetical protein